MKKTDIYNNVSDSLLKETKLKPGQQAIYRVSSITRNPIDPSEILIPAGVNVPVYDQIWDEEQQEYVDIAAISKINPDGNHMFYELWFLQTQGGHMILTGGRAADQEIHSYLSLCNYNGSNPRRDTSKPIIFELVDEAKKSEQERKNRNFKREALNVAADLSADDVKIYTAALGKDDSKPLEQLRNELEQMADRDPKEFLDLVNNKQSTMKAVINRALLKGVIVFSAEQSRFSWPNGEAILSVARVTGQDAVDELVSFCVSSAKGEKVYQTISAKSKK
jgi:hypothetical protein